ncbi:hypothetical protein MEPL4_8c00180 [Melissococcus plutonius]|uniref:Uncharacterized protein n=1 Tax=Melissococcus plutonius TaxID=33970 RepID=A0A2Z5Y4W4_9ENTE|nr:hypothetical protein [Melissococcus plutonius]KMT26983.1 hypothetical protein MEPL4_8c00180 [Melissococcus plutonius]KMT29096.1 hypothetical protein MEPL7_19p00040 [Melissococcus plutonius]KMT33566.1 hypothetical protein MEPL9_11c00190 [Melissococcus plutonius]KMT37792.1 hypothetical protein MEPL11_9c00020 [Melissococcus plutonius]BBC61866.1 hypothetical protein DAT561_p0004 [Melissococcus plutonius]
MNKSRRNSCQHVGFTIISLLLASISFMSYPQLARWQALCFLNK